ncbi:MAG: hypothetical protein HPY55_01665 [Firmicutes bacterium]|nr:hypothetical protein [Bacillota bacterium]
MRKDEKIARYAFMCMAVVVFAVVGWIITRQTDPVPIGITIIAGCLFLLGLATWLGRS